MPGGRPVDALGLHVERGFGAMRVSWAEQENKGARAPLSDLRGADYFFFCVSSRNLT